LGGSLGVAALRLRIALVSACLRRRSSSESSGKGFPSYSLIPKKSTREPTAVRNEVLSSINNALCLESYEYENQTVKVHNVKGRLHKNIQFWKEKLLLAESSKNLVLPILEYGYLLTFKQEPPSVILRNNKSAFEHTFCVKRSIAKVFLSKIVYFYVIYP
jgi:hypothetical protein